jgi:SAM-dependent methyltransferase
VIAVLAPFGRRVDCPHALKLSNKIGKLARREAYQRAWRRVQRKLHPVPLRPLLAKIDQKRLGEIQARYPYSPWKASKYTKVEQWLKLNIERVQDLKLHQLPPQEILDLGCGGGFFLFICRELGHHGLGLDREGAPVFRELIELLHVERRFCEIKAFEPVPDLGRKFDWITGFSTGFNRREDRSLWGPPEWSFLLQDLRKHLRPGGKVFFGLNPAQGGWYYTDELRDFFIRSGARVERECIFFPHGISPQESV